ncbi:CHC2 zinc finger domain-containing protein [Anaeromassilibacillus senegalensis]|uniref:DNA primase n=1 Tax=Anaeromassilibacillus senegalensis TaxID=1673717 RepID=A0ABS9CT39_9FIRM|nr:CHC2 zinc finger domain-containing protein [Anaeromassilibacillus senegalensis]MCF2653282.1 DNA primase [Anaeromassilibacillus senegalensis]
MNQFERVKAAVPLRQAAETYGLTVSRNGMTCCPFHEDRHPSMKLNEDYFFCFGCGASGDVIDFTARLFGISLKDAAEKLTADFGISADIKPIAIRQNPSRLDELRCRRALTDYLHLLKKWKTQYAPNTPEDSLDDHFVESCQQYDRIAGLLEMLDEASSTQRSHAVSALTADGSVAFWEGVVAENRKEARYCAKEPAIA